jgi:hypothetical protein
MSLNPYPAMVVVFSGVNRIVLSSKTPEVAALNPGYNLHPAKNYKGSDFLFCELCVPFDRAQDMLCG